MLLLISFLLRWMVSVGVGVAKLVEFIGQASFNPAPIFDNLPPEQALPLVLNHSSIAAIGRG